MSKCISIHGEYSEHEYTSKPTCDYCGQISEMLAIVQNEDFRTALVSIQELHKREDVTDFFGDGQVRCADCRQWFPCSTRKLADEALNNQPQTNGGNND